MNGNRRTTYDKRKSSVTGINSRKKPVNRSAYPNGVSRQSSAKKRIVKKKRRSMGLKVGGFIIRPRFIALLLALTVVVGTVIGISTRPPDLYDIDYGSITMYETVDAVLIKDETGYTYPEGVTVVSRLPDGSHVETGDIIAVVRTLGFNNDWYNLLNLARQETIDYMTKRLDPEREDHAEILEAAAAIDNTIAALSEEMLGVIITSPERYSVYSEQLKELYRQKRDTLFRAFNGDGNLDELITREELRQAQIDENTMEITAIRSGILSYNTDGYANIYNYESIDAVTETVYDNILEDSYSTAIKNTRGLCDYYISDMNTCYIAMKGSGDIFKYLQNNDDAIIRMNDGNMQYVATIKDVKESTGCNYIIAEPAGDFGDFYRERVVSVTVQKTWSGLIVPREHVVKKREKEGVYIYEDKKKIFTPIEVLAQNESIIVLNTDSINNVFKKGMFIVKK